MNNYISVHKTQLLDSLESQVFYANLASVVIGESGLGKTFLIKSLCLRLKNQVDLVKVDAEKISEQIEIDQKIIKQLDLNTNSLKEWLENKVSSTQTQLEFNKILLVIDNAHILTEECLDYLLSLAKVITNQNQNLIYLLLVGESELAPKLNATPVLKQQPDFCVVFELQPIEIDETRHLIADFQDLDVEAAELLYDSQKFEFFWKLSRGIPGKLHYQLHRWLTETEKNNEPYQKIEDENKKNNQLILSIGYSCLALLLILVLVYQDDINELFLTEENNQPEIEFIELPLPQNAPSQKTLNQQTIDNDLGDSNSDENNSEGKSLSDKLLAEKGLIGKEAPSVLLTDNTTEFDAEKLKFNDKTSQKTKVSQNTNAFQEGGNQEAAKTEITDLNVVDETRKPKNLIQNNDGDTSISSQPKRVTDIAKKPIEADQVKQESKKISEVLEKSEPIAEGFQLMQGERALLTKQQSGFLLQWVAVSQLESAKRFVYKHPLKDQMFIFRRKQKAGYFYLVASGDYQTRLLADEARASFTLKGYPGNPWIKSFKSVQQDIKALNS